MKSIFLTLTFVVAFAGSLFAQKLTAGVKAGVNFASLMHDFKMDGAFQNARTSFHMGLFATIRISEKISVQPELLYNSLGNKIDFGSDGFLQDKLNYLSIPVLLRFQPGRFLNIHAGPQFGYLVSATREFGPESDDYKDEYKSTDFGVAIGAGVDLPAGFGLSARYIMGVTNVSGSTTPGNVPMLTNNSIQLSLVYKIIGKE